MKTKTIKKVLQSKIDHWKESIHSDSVKKAIDNSVIVTGGAIASMLLGEEVNDFDVYFSNKKDAMIILEYYQREDLPFEIGFPEGFQHQSDHEVDESERIYINVNGGALKIDKDWGEEKYMPIFLSNNAITLTGKIQLIFRFIGDAETIHSNYDFVHCTNYYTYKDNKLELKRDALASLLAKDLTYIGSKYPVCSLIRTRKYINRGFTCNAGEFVKMCWQVSKLDLSDVNVLREQLVGVDIHYFNVMLNALMTKKEEDKDFEITDSYIFTLIDKIFN